MALADEVDTSCIYQDSTPSGLVCQIAITGGQYSTCETTPDVCADCCVGKVQRECGCRHIGGKVHLLEYVGGTIGASSSAWCTLLKLEPTLEECHRCVHIESSSAVPVVADCLDLLEAAGFTRARAELVEARTKLQELDFDGCIRVSTVAVESALKMILDSKELTYPPKEQITGLWKAVRGQLHEEEDEVAGERMVQVAGSINGTISALAGARNDLSDAHGRGNICPELRKSYAELCLNLSASLVTYVVRRTREIVA